MRVEIDAVSLSDDYPATRVVVRAHYRPEPSITTEIGTRVWEPVPGGGWSTTVGSIPTVIFADLLEWVDTEVEVGDRRARP